MFSQEYAEHLSRGPFPGRIDPWAEAGRYFQQIHSGMINHFLEQIQIPLIQKGYIAAKELMDKPIRKRLTQAGRRCP